MAATLRTVQSWATAWEAGYLPWLRAACQNALASTRPTLLIAPTQADLRHARFLAMDAGLDPFAIHFETPSRLRERLIEASGQVFTHPLREHLMLLLAVAAEKIGGPAAEAVVSSPEGLLAAIDLLGAAGWEFSEAGPVTMRPIVAEFQRLLDACGFTLPHRADFALKAASPGRPPLFANLCMVGFEAAHWNQWPLLSAATHAAQEAQIHLRLPGERAADLDRLWIGTWEQDFGAASPVEEEDPRPSKPATEFLIATDVVEESAAIVQQALEFLSRPGCDRLAILFPQRSALSRRVAAELARRDVAHYDGVGHPLPGPLESPDWPVWLDLQESPRLPALVAFLRRFPRAESFFGDTPIPEVIDKLQRAFKELLLDDLDVLAAWVTPLTEGLKKIPRLPAEATLSEFIAHAAKAFTELGWPERAGELERKTIAWPAVVDATISRHTFTRWLRQLMESRRDGRSSAGNHPYSRIHLLLAHDAGAQAWSHVIFAGANEGAWPRAFDQIGWIGEPEITALNQKVRVLNQRVIQQGSQGEGHEVIAPGHTFCLAAGHHRALAERDFYFAVECSTALAFTASLTDESAPERTANPSEFLTLSYHEAHGQALSRESMQALSQRTARWLASSGLWTRPAPTPIPAVRQAYDSRRQPGTEFGEYQFALRQPLPRMPQFSATEWESALSNPGIVWLGRFLGVHRREDDSVETPWGATIGDWVHRWLAAMSGTSDRGQFVPTPAPVDLLARVMASAQSFRTRVEAITTPPEWWVATWELARRFALDLARSVAAVKGHGKLATEWSIPNDVDIPVGTSGTLKIRGRIDLLLAASPTELWLVDYKTGATKALAANKVATGDGLQLALYALVLGRNGAEQVGLSRLTRELALDSPQLTLAEVGLDALPDLWRGLARMNTTGIFGSLGELRDEFSFAAEHPLATLRIDPDLLAEKWLLTHPSFALSLE